MSTYTAADAVTRAKPATEESPVINPARRGPIVVAAKGGDDPPAALTLAARIAARLGEPLEVVSVLEPVLVVGESPGIVLAPDVFDPSAIEHRRETVAASIPHCTGDAAWSLSMRVGRPAFEICEFARGVNASLIVVGASPRRSLRRVVTGQRAGQVLHGADSPVLSVMPWGKHSPGNVVAAIDFGVASIRAAQAALLMMEPGATLTLVHVTVPSYTFPGLDAPVESRFPERIVEELNRLARVLEKCAPPGVDICSLVVSGEPVTEILRFSESIDADMIATGTNGHTALRRAVLGSVAAGIVHTAMTNVLASPPPALAGSVAGGIPGVVPEIRIRQ